MEWSSEYLDITTNPTCQTRVQIGEPERTVRTIRNIAVESILLCLWGHFMTNVFTR